MVFRLPAAFAPIALLGALLGALLAALPQAAAAEGGDVALPCRPTIACTAEIVEGGRTEVEAGYTARRYAGDFQHTTPLLLKFSVTDRFQLQAGSNGWTFQPTASRYLDDLQLLAKVVLTTQGEARPAVSVSATLSFPTGLGDVGYTPGFDAQGLFYVTKDLGWFHGDLNLGANVLYLDRSPRLQPCAAFSASTDLGHGLTPMVEWYYFAAAGPGAPQDAGFLAAMGFSVARWLVIDVGGDVGLGEQARRFSLFVGFTALSPRLWRV